MSETMEESPVEQLQALRALMVEERRRRVAVALEIHRANGEGAERWGPDLMAIQEHIEAVERALVDENGLSSSNCDSLVMAS